MFRFLRSKSVTEKWNNASKSIESRVGVKIYSEYPTQDECHLFLQFIPLLTELAQQLTNQQGRRKSIDLSVTDTDSLKDQGIECRFSVEIAASSDYLIAKRLQRMREQMSQIFDL